jgi:tetratricopeptide (TPR) repeat protein
LRYVCKFRKIFFSFFILGVAGIASGCASPAKQTENFLKTPRNIPETHRISDVSFIQQTENFCGPASLSMMMNWAGHPISVDELGSQMYTPGKKGTLQADILSASRRQGMLAIPIHGISALLNEIAAGNPVLLLQNLAFSWYPKWHYAVALGYDLDVPVLILHSGPDAFKRMDLRDFESTWALADYWGVVVLPPEKLSVTANDLEHASAAAALERIGKNSEAEEVYKNILKRWPESLSGLIGIGNTRYAVGQYFSSVHFVNQATQKHPQSAVAWHNLATAQGSAKLFVQARKSALRAIGLADPKTSDIYRESLRKWLEPGS